MPGDMIDTLEQIWQAILDATSLFVMPDWGELVGLLPVFLLVGVIGPLLSLIVLVWVIYAVRKPRVSVTYEEGPRAAALGPGGQPEFPAGEPYCHRDALVYDPGTVRCDACRSDLLVACPKCGVVRPAYADTCAACGLVLTIVPRDRVLVPTAAPPGGATLA